jgi:cytoskeletal protein CcmA (bactofilin family)
MWKSDLQSAPAPTSTPVPFEPARATLVQTPVQTPPVDSIVMDLGSSIVITGELSASEDLTLYGQMDGRITLPDHTLTIGSKADIRAEIAAKAVVIMGTVTGNVTAGENVAIRATGSVTGDLVSPRLAIEDGGRLHGRVETPSPS